MRRILTITVVRDAMLAAGALWTMGCTEGTAPAAPAPVARQVAVGGYTLSAREWAGAGPTVVFLAGLGEPQATWREVPGDVARFARVVTYDRGGVGASGDGGDARTSRDVAAELDRFLTSAGLPGPYILVGHSLGALHMQQFAQRYPARVAGLVFVDGTPAKAILPIRDAVPPGTTVEELLTGAADQIGLTGGARREFIAQVTSADQVVAAGRLPDVPVVVLTSTKVEEGGSAEERQAALALQGEWATQVTRGTQVATSAGHHIHWEAPALVVEAICAVVRELR